ncbi:hypothetical protein [Dyadobacter frigoris]|uniref:Uncharacterized protein n=1 Tax=Dyadobacter frigoris TaxID=2576211 RepID=A0A4U6D7Q5_9BACT|nr:hypothetical protein [Dyadobacter frigoris]TKT93442.1 hypothetical protein FDK13_06215 [Dyadobacter frigoris]GLU55835.1 hypothetical protein Dfri01_52960 [Dyadobacter frigoris]
MKYFYTRSNILLLLSCLFYPFSGISQHQKLPVSDFSERDYEPVSDNTTLTKGQTRCFSGTGILNELTIDGGTLVITGKVKIKKLTILKGNILVAKKGSAMLPSFEFNGNSSLINYGSVTFTGNVSLNHNRNYIANAGPGSKINWGSAKFNFGGKKSIFINNGTTDIGTLILDSKNGKILLGPNSLTNVVNLVNNYGNRIYVPTGIAKLSQAGFAELPQSLTNSPNLIICPGPSSDIRIISASAGGYGHANVMEKGCTSFPSAPNTMLTSYK